MTRSTPAVGAIPHVVIAVSAFLDRSMELSLAEACSFGSLRLLQRIWDGSQAAGLSASSLWPPSVLMWTNLHYYRHQFAQSMIEAAKLGDLSMIRWLFERFSDCDVPKEAVEEAARRDHRHILQFLWTYQKEHRDIQAGRENCDDVVEEDKPHRVNLRYADPLLMAATAGHGPLVIWIYEEMYRSIYTHDINAVLDQLGRHGDLEVLQRILAKRYWCPPRLDYVAEGGNLEMMKWILDQGFGDGERSSLKNAAAHGHLEMVELLVDKELVYLEGQAFSGAAKNGHLSAVKWLKENNLGLSTANRALDLAASAGHMDVVAYLHEKCGAVLTSNTMRVAAMNGGLGMVQ